MKECISYVMKFVAEILCVISKLFVFPTRMKVEMAYALVSTKYKFRSLPPKYPLLKTCNSDIILSIIVPVYNAEDFLERCVTSLINQHTSFKYEIVFINDGSTDKSLSILNRFVYDYPDRCRVITQDNQGISAARNKGIEVAFGIYVSFIDNDDFVDDSYVDILLKKAIAEDADMVQCGYTRNNQQGKVIGKDVIEQDVVINKGHTNLVKYVHGYIWGGVYKRELFNLIRFPNGYWYEDIVTRLFLMNICQKVCIIKDAIYHKTFHRTNASITLWRKTDYKCIDQYHLTKELTDNYCLLHKGFNEVQYNIVVEEFAFILKDRISGLPFRLQKAVFVLASDYINTFPYSFKCYTKVDKNFEKVLRKKRFLAWNLLFFSMKFYNKSRWLHAGI